MRPMDRTSTVRSTRPDRLHHFALALLLAGSACSDCSTGTGTSQGVLTVQPASVDFGKLRVGESKRRQLVLTNGGTGTLGLVEVTREGLPESVSIGALPALLEPGASIGIPLIWSPQEEETLDGTLTFVTDSAIALTVDVAVKGRGLLGKLTVDPLVVDFGIAEVGKPVSRDVTVKNDGELEESVRIQPANDSLQFALDYPQGDTLSLVPGDEGRFTATYNPVRISPPGAADVSRVELVPCDGCTAIVVELRGRAVDSFVDVVPGDCLEFGLVNPGSTATKPVRITNRGARPVQVNGASTPTGSGFTVAGSLPATLAQDAVATLDVTFTPTELRRYQSTLQVETDDTSRPVINLCIRGSGGGPDIQVTPPALDFGIVAVGLSRTRVVSVANVGLGTAAGSTLSVSEIRFEGATVFTADTAPFTVVPGATRSLVVTYQPPAERADTATLVLVSDDVDAPETRVPLAGTARNLPPCDLGVVPAGGTLEFGNVSQGRTATLVARLTNAGTGDCVVSDVSFSAATPTAFSLPTEVSGDIVLAPGQSLPIPVKFQPVRSGRATGELRFAVSDPVTPSRTIALSGGSESGCLFIAPNELDFGTVGAGCATRERIVTAYNTCTGSNVSIESIRFADGTDASFVLVGVPANLPAPIVGSAISFRARFFPQANGEFTGAILVKSNEPNSLPYNVGLFGRAADDARQTDTFDQRARPSADVLFVIDNSGSMGDEQQALSQNFGAFMQYALSLDFDYHLAATTTDVGDLGVFLSSSSGVRVITPETPFPAENFAEIVNPGINGSGDERGLEAMELALSPPSIDNENAGFLRPEAFLTVIVISDEEDSSNESLAYYEQFLLNVKGARAANLVSFNAIAEPGTRYETFATTFQGQFVDIGQPTWASALTALGTNAFSFRTRFFLTATPGDVAQVEVRINGQVIPARMGTIIQWRYDPAQNAVIFDPLTIPEPGDVLEVSYPVACIR